MAVTGLREGLTCRNPWILQEHQRQKKVVAIRHGKKWPKNRGKSKEKEKSMSSQRRGPKHPGYHKSSNAWLSLFEQESQSPGLDQWHWAWTHVCDKSHKVPDPLGLMRNITLDGTTCHCPCLVTVPTDAPQQVKQHKLPKNSIWRASPCLPMILIC